MKTGDKTSEGKTIICVTNSSMSEFRNCRYKYWLNYVKKYTAKAGSPALEDGSIWHNCLEKYYNKQRAKKILQDMKVEYDGLLTSAKVNLNDNMKEGYMNRMHMLMGMFTGYMAEYSDDLDRWSFVWPGTEVSTLEIEFCIKLYEDEKFVVYNQGKLDGLGYDNKKKEWWVWEHKSTGRIDQAYLDKLPMDSQCMQYLWAAEQILSTYGIKAKVKGVIYNVTKKCQLKRKKATTNKKAETKKDYVKRVQLDYKKRPDFYFVRQPVKFSDRQLKNYETDIKRLGQSISAAIEEPKKHMYKNYSQCTVYGRCTFMGICVACSLDGPHMSYYHQRETEHQELGGKA